MDNSIGFSEPEAALTSALAVIGLCVMAEQEWLIPDVTERVLQLEKTFPGTFEGLKGKLITKAEIDNLIEDNS
jgi:hypothetical protein